VKESFGLRVFRDPYIAATQFGKYCHEELLGLWRGMF